MALGIEGRCRYNQAASLDFESPLGQVLNEGRCAYFEGDYTPHEINRSDSGDSRFGGSAAG
jgi:hypothetical protein